MTTTDDCGPICGTCHQPILTACSCDWTQETNMETTYAVENGQNDRSGEGMDLATARKTAQYQANQTGETRYVVSTDPSEQPEEFAPEQEAAAR